MAVTTTYSWQFVQNLEGDFGTAAADVTSLASGGFAVLGDLNGQITGTMYNSSGAAASGWPNTGTNGAIDQLSNGNLVIASQDADSTLFKVVSSVTGNDVVATVDLGFGHDADVAALTGGSFWIVNRTSRLSGIMPVTYTDSIVVTVRNNDGSSAATSFTVDSVTVSPSSSATVSGPSVAGLDTGAVAVAWTRTGAFEETYVGCAVYNSAGGVIKAPRFFDGEDPFFGDSGVNRNVSIAAINGGFAIAYEDDSWDEFGNVNVTLAVFDSVGNFVNRYNVSEGHGNLKNPSVTRLSNGLLAVSMSDNTFGDGDTVVKLVDPATGAVLAGRNATGGVVVDNNAQNSTLTGFGLGRVAVYHTDLTANDIKGEDLQGVRTSTGDGAHDTIVGDDFVDFMSGGAGNDTLNGGLGKDTLNGGVGNDTYVLGAESDTVTDADGIDTITSTITRSLISYGAIENLTLVGSADINGTGNGFANTIVGNNGGNVINGGGGTDTMIGLGGHDGYFVDSADDVVNEALNGGTDRVLTSVSYTLKANQHIEVFTTTNSASTGVISLIGNNLAQTIVGNAGVNYLTGGGGTDTLNGLGGTDQYFVDNVGDVVNEALNAGNDRVFTSVSYTLKANQYIEEFSTTNSASTGVISLIGNNLAQTIFGNAGVNYLTGGGGTDTLNGLGGTDQYFVDNVGDVVNEALNAGNDRVFTSVSYTLKANQYIEEFSTTNSASTGVISLIGNNLAQTIFGNAGVNYLNGGGGTDTLIGLGGADQYFVDSALDKIVETTGTDNVNASVSYTLAAGVAVETLRTVNAAATTAINLTGNNVANIVTGNAGNNILDGGSGNDTLTGNAGNDIFAFSTALSAAANVDTIVGFVVVSDTVRLENSIFTGLAAGTLNADAFHKGAASADAEDRIIYNSATGALSFDSNGNAAGGVTKFAQLTAGLSLTNADFLVI